MTDVAGHEEGEGANRDRPAIGDTRRIPALWREPLEEPDIGLPHQNEFLYGVREGDLGEARVFCVRILVESGQFVRIQPAEHKGAVPEDALRVAHVPGYFANRPLSWRVRPLLA